MKRIGRFSRQKQIAELNQKFLDTGKISPRKLAIEIKEIGFECLHCGKCCTGADNSVFVFPFEIRLILATTKQTWLDEVEPPTLGEWDSEGNFHTLEWRLRKRGHSCRFRSHDRCSIYGARPLLCKTYPFYLDEGLLRCSECEGLGKMIEYDDAKRIAAKLIERSRTEINESIALLEKYEDFSKGCPKEGGACIVHDSDGLHWIPWTSLPYLKNRISRK